MEVRCAKLSNCWVLRQKGPHQQKLHNLVLWIQKAPQRIQKFKDLTTDESDARNSWCPFSAVRLMLIWCYRAYGNPRQFNQVEFILLLDPRVLLLKNRLQLLTRIFAEDLDEDVLSAEDWQTLQYLERILKPFQTVTKRLEGKATEG